jgi:hypothetical protein
MSVLNPRNRLVNFRLSEVEFEKLKEACARQSARSISDFARTSVLRSLDEPRELAAPPYPRMSSLDQKVAELEIRVEQLLRLMSAAGAAPLAQSGRVGMATDGGELQQN